jgi:hypothetical protein
VPTIAVTLTGTNFVVGANRCQPPAPRDGMKRLALVPPKNAERRVAKRLCLIEHRIEDGREIAGRGIDDL